MLELILSLLVVVAAIIGYKKCKTHFEDDRALRMLTCLGCAVAAVLAGLYAAFTLVMLLPL